MIETEEKQTNDNSQSIAISAKELAGLLGVSVRQIWRLNATAKLPKNLRLGGSVKWSRSEIMGWFEAGCPNRATWEARKEVEKC